MSTATLRERKTTLRNRVESELKKIESQEIERQCRTFQQTNSSRLIVESGRTNEACCANGAISESTIDSNFPIHARQGGLNP